MWASHEMRHLRPILFRPPTGIVRRRPNPKMPTFADPKGWVVLDEFVRSDEEITGASLAIRPALKSLIADAQRRPRPFDRILVDDTSRLARNVADALKMVEILTFHGVGVTFVSQCIDTLEK